MALIKVIISVKEGMNDLTETVTSAFHVNESNCHFKLPAQNKVHVTIFCKQSFFCFVF